MKDKISEEEFERVMSIAEGFKPLQDRVLVHMLNVKPRSQKIQIITKENDTKVAFDEHPWQGLVVAVGDGYNGGNGIVPMEVKVGDHVALYMPPDSERETLLLGKQLFGLFRVSNIMGKFINLKK